MRKKSARKTRKVYHRKKNSVGMVVFIVFMVVGIFAGVSLVQSGSQFYGEAQPPILPPTLTYPTLTVTPTTVWPINQ